MGSPTRWLLPAAFSFLGSLLAPVARAVTLLPVECVVGTASASFAGIQQTVPYCGLYAGVNSAFDPSNPNALVSDARAATSIFHAFNLWIHAGIVDTLSVPLELSAFSRATFSVPETSPRVRIHLYSDLITQTAPNSLAWSLVLEGEGLTIPIPLPSAINFESRDFVLPAGDYDLVGQLDAELFSGGGSHQISVRYIQLLPEPGTNGLFAAVLVLLGMVRLRLRPQARR